MGGSDQSKAIEQLGKETLSNFDYCFFENGLVAFKDGKEIHRVRWILFYFFLYFFFIFFLFFFVLFVFFSFYFILVLFFLTPLF